MKHYHTEGRMGGIFGYCYIGLCVVMYRLYNEVEVSTGYTLPRAAGPRLCIP